MESALFDRERVRERCDPTRVTEAVEAAFAAEAEGRTVMPAKTYIDLERYNGDFRAMPAYVDAGDWEAAGVKWVNVHLDNPTAHDLPTVMGIMLYSDPETALPLAVMDGTELTRQRTAAVAAVATDHLAIEGASSLGIVGAGAQSYKQVEYIADVRPIERIVVSDLDEDAVDRFCEHFAPQFTVASGSPADAARCDVVSTLTPVRDPIVPRSAVDDGTHINAIGADAAGKQELDPAILRAARVVIDDVEQCRHSGEVNVPWSEGLIDEGSIHGTLGEVVSGRVSGREISDEITVFDSTGLAIQDVAAAHVVYGDGGSAAAYDFLQLE